MWQAKEEQYYGMGGAGGKRENGLNCMAVWGMFCL